VVSDFYKKFQLSENEDTAPLAVWYQNSSEANPPSLKLQKGSLRLSSSRRAARYSGEGEEKTARGLATQ